MAREAAERLWDRLGLPGGSLGGGAGRHEPCPVGGARSRYHSFDVGPDGLPPLVAARQLRVLQPDRTVSGLPRRARRWRCGRVGAVSGLGRCERPGDVLPARPAERPLPRPVRGWPGGRRWAGVIGGLVGLGARQLLVPTVPDIGAAPVVAAFSAQAQNRPPSTAASRSTRRSTRPQKSFAGIPALEPLRFDAFEPRRVVSRSRGGTASPTSAACLLEGLYIADASAPAPTIVRIRDEHLFWDVVHPSAAAT